MDLYVFQFEQSRRDRVGMSTSFFFVFSSFSSSSFPLQLLLKPRTGAGGGGRGVAFVTGCRGNMAMLEVVFLQVPTRKRKRVDVLAADQKDRKARAN